MSLSLEVKKFINSEHTGEYIEIELPGELEVRRPRTKKAQAHPNLGRRTRPARTRPARTRLAAMFWRRNPLRSLCRKRSMNVRASTTLKRGRGNR